MECGDNVSKLKEEITKQQNIPADRQIIELYDTNLRRCDFLKDEDTVDRFKDKNLYMLTLKEGTNIICYVYA